MVRRLVTLLCLVFGPAAAAAQQGPEPVEVMIVGTFHMSNPGRDVYNAQIEDVLTPRHQADLEAISAGLARFRPSWVAVEWGSAAVEERYPAFLDGTLPPSRNEVVQVGFRLAREAGGIPVVSIDADGDFPYGALIEFAEAHGMGNVLDEENAKTERMLRHIEALVAGQGLSAALRYVNDPEQLAGSNSWYRTTLRIGEGDAQPGVDLLTAWYRRNFLICANLIRRAQPGDRIVVLFGAGHALLLRQCVAETPGFRLVEPNDYLPEPADG